ncbi:hypothetical protein DV515_00005017 [Chloebia gouldiae]|uniref:Uncharacterized protein n=1 Tax=Chloebia gouldiae TaxID=44316 RepID=A0A3L8SQ63_CHLGU|nr:hypothetical protein DV515_00005017 [Chloebia gouldiae]
MDSVPEKVPRSFVCCRHKSSLALTNTTALLHHVLQQLLNELRRVYSPTIKLGENERRVKEAAFTKEEKGKSLKEMHFKRNST